MSLNLNALSGFLSTVAGHKATGPTALATVISAGLYAAQFAGAPIPNIALLLGPVAGLFIYKMLPAKAEAEIDSVTQKIEDVASEVPTLTDQYPTGKNGQGTATSFTTIQGVSNKG